MNALANPEVGMFLNRCFVSSFQKVATFRIVNGQKQGGNVAAYFCAPDGRVLHAIAGPVDAATMLREARWVVDAVKKAAEESKKTGASFKEIFRRWHAERLRNEHGLIVEASTFDPPEAKDDGPLTVRDVSGRPLAPVLPPPPIDGPDVSFKDAARVEAEGRAAAACAPALQDSRGRCVLLGNQGRVHQLMAAYAMVKIERLYGTIFENILGEKVSTQPVQTLGGVPGVETAVCLRCVAPPPPAPLQERVEE